jgi:hypothetical protein
MNQDYTGIETPPEDIERGMIPTEVRRGDPLLSEEEYGFFTPWELIGNQWADQPKTKRLSRVEAFQLRQIKLQQERDAAERARLDLPVPSEQEQDEAQTAIDTLLEELKEAKRSVNESAIFREVDPDTGEKLFPTRESVKKEINDRKANISRIEDSIVEAREDLEDVQTRRSEVESPAYRREVAVAVSEAIAEAELYSATALRDRDKENIEAITKHRFAASRGYRTPFKLTHMLARQLPPDLRSWVSLDSPLVTDPAAPGAQRVGAAAAEEAVLGPPVPAPTAAPGAPTAAPGAPTGPDRGLTPETKEEQADLAAIFTPAVREDIAEFIRIQQKTPEGQEVPKEVIEAAIWSIRQSVDSQGGILTSENDIDNILLAMNDPDYRNTLTLERRQTIDIAQANLDRDEVLTAFGEQFGPLTIVGGQRVDRTQNEILTMLRTHYREAGLIDDEMFTTASGVDELEKILLREMMRIDSLAWTNAVGGPSETLEQRYTALVQAEIAASAEKHAAAGGLKESLLAPLDYQTRVRQSLAQSGRLPGQTTKLWTGHIQDIAAHIKSEIENAEARKAATGVEYDEDDIINTAIDEMYKDPGQLKIESADLRTRFDLISNRPQRVAGEKVEDVDFFLTREFEKVQRQYDLAVATGKKPNFEVMASKAVLDAQKKVSQVSAASSAFFGPTPPGVGTGVPVDGFSDDDVAALRLFYDAVGGANLPAHLTGIRDPNMVSDDDIRKYIIPSPTLELSLIAGRGLLRQERAKTKAAEDAVKALTYTKEVEAEREESAQQLMSSLEEQTALREEGEEPLTLAEARTISGVGTPVEPQKTEPEAETAKPLTRAEVLASPTGQTQYEATTRLLTGQANVQIQAGQQAAAAEAEAKRVAEELERDRKIRTRGGRAVT